MRMEAYDDDDDDDDFLDRFQGIKIPVKERKQTNALSFIILTVFVGFLAGAIFVAIGEGDIRRLTHGYDENGNICGVKNNPIDGIHGSGLDLRKHKYLMLREYCTSFQECWTEKECVEECTDGYDSSIIPRCISGKDETQVMLKPLFEMVMSDLSLFWKEIAGLCLLTILTSGVILTLLTMHAKIVIGILLLVVSIAAIGFTIHTWIMYLKVTSVNLTNYAEPEKETWHSKMDFWYMSVLIVDFSVTVYFGSLFILRKKIKLVTVFFEEGGKCIKDIPTMLLTPVLTHLITAAFLCFMVFGYLCLITSGKAEVDYNGSVSFPNTIVFQITSWLLLFGILWVSQFLVACQNLVIAGAVSSWYFSRTKGKLINPVRESFRMIRKYHLGSAAFGSLLIAIFKVLRRILRSNRDGRKPLTLIVRGVMQCLLAGIETFLRILSKTAYVMIVLLGDPFCISAYRAYFCISTDRADVPLLIGAETCIMAAVELLITFVITFIGLNLNMDGKEVQIFWVPTCAVFVLSYICCHGFFSVYNMAIDTLIVCFCVDHQMNNGHDKPYYMNENLKESFLDEYDFKTPDRDDNNANILMIDLKNLKDLNNSCSRSYLIEKLQMSMATSEEQCIT